MKVERSGNTSRSSLLPVQQMPSIFDLFNHTFFNMSQKYTSIHSVTYMLMPFFLLPFVLFLIHFVNWCACVWLWNNNNTEWNISILWTLIMLNTIMWIIFEDIRRCCIWSLLFTFISSVYGVSIKCVRNIEIDVFN